MYSLFLELPRSLWEILYLCLIYNVYSRSNFSKLYCGFTVYFPSGYSSESNVQTRLRTLAFAGSSMVVPPAFMTSERIFRRTDLCLEKKVCSKPFFNVLPKKPINGCNDYSPGIIIPLVFCGNGVDKCVPIELDLQLCIGPTVFLMMKNMLYTYRILLFLFTQKNSLQTMDSQVSVGTTFWMVFTNITIRLSVQKEISSRILSRKKIRCFLTSLTFHSGKTHFQTSSMKGV